MDFRLGNGLFDLALFFDLFLRLEFRLEPETPLESTTVCGSNSVSAV